MKKIGIYFAFIFTAISSFGQKNNDNKKNEPETFFGKIWIVKPGENYAAILTKLQPGDELQLHEGIYEGNALINNSGLPDKPIIIRGYGNGEKRPVLLWKGTNENLCQINGSNLVLDFLEFRSKYTYSIRMGRAGKGNSNVTIKNCVFYESGDGDISANAPVDYDNIHILDNYFIGPKKTPVYIGQHAGKANVTNFTFKGNVIDGSQIYGDSITGYGIEVKLNVTGSVIENNYITNTKGPGIMVYGAEKSGTGNSNIIRNNIVVGSRNDAGIVVGGGPATVEDNLIVGCLGGIEVMNYGHRNLLDNIILRNNTALCNRNYGMSFGNAQNINAQNNIVISTDSLSGFIRNKNLGINNKFNSASKESEMIVQKKLMNIIPARNNLKKIWLHASSGPLSQADVLEIIDLILEYKIPVQISN
jgi:hypothetical protein